MVLVTVSFEHGEGEGIGWRDVHGVHDEEGRDKNEEVVRTDCREDKSVEHVDGMSA